MNKLDFYYKDKKIIEELHFNKKDNNDFYLFNVRLIYNSFITNHILLDGNKRMFKKEIKKLNRKVSKRSLR